MTTDEGEKFAKRNGLIFFETSAKTSAGVEHTFTMAAKQIYQGIITQRYEVQGDFNGIKVGNAELPASVRISNPTSKSPIQTPQQLAIYSPAPVEKKSGCC